MKLTTTILSGLLATTTSALFDKWSPWGKRDYSCINVYQGVPENATLAANWPVQISFNRDSSRCDSTLNNYPTGNYSIWLYNNPVRVPNSLTSDYRGKVIDGISPNTTRVTITLPANLPEVEDDTVWYLRLDTYLPSAPQMPTLFNAMGPFRLLR